MAFVLVCTLNIFAQNFSISFDPLTFLGLLVSPKGDTAQEPVDIRNMWICVELNMDTSNQKELGFGIFARADRVALRTQYRTFSNSEQQSGFFWGFYGLIEWRQMYWLYDEDNNLAVGWSFPLQENENIYHSIGLTGGVDIGFRIRIDRIGVTPYFGFGIPLFYCFNDKPPETKEFFLQNSLFRAIDVGLRLDFFL